MIVLLILWPYHDGTLRYGLPLAIFSAWLTSLLLAGPRNGRRLLLGMIPLLLISPFLLPSKPIDPETLRAHYVAAMKSMEGTPYVWGGESRSGVDCSGLPRRALRDALWQDAWQHCNGNAFRAWAEQWWFDTSAKALGQNYRGFTRPLAISGLLRDINPEHLLPGDLAVTDGGVHVIVYLEGGRWIQADPSAAKVIIGKSQQDSIPWHDSPVSLHRWMLLEE